MGNSDIRDVRRRFSSLGPGFAFFDAPGGTQVPDEVGLAIAGALQEASGNVGAPYETGKRVQEILEEAERKTSAFLGCQSHEVIFGMNMTTLNFALTRTAARDFESGDEIIISGLDHDGGVAPWLELARDKELVVRQVELHPDTTLDMRDLERKLSERTRVVAFAWASNAVGTIVDAQRVCELAHEASALAWVDAVHYAAHEPINVQDVDADVLLCSPYKWCGPHLGIAVARTEILERWRPYKARPAPTQPINRAFETGTLPYELLAGLNATFHYIDSIGGMATIRAYERDLGALFLRELVNEIAIYGLPGMTGRVPTFLLNIEGVEAADVAGTLADRGYGVWAHDNWYSLGLYDHLGYEGRAIRVGIAHYNTAEEVMGLANELAQIATRGRDYRRTSAVLGEATTNR